MRPLDKGIPQKDYSDYSDAKPGLKARNGPFCAYCEMPVRDLGYVDHVHPLANGGAALDWSNFLLSCFFCNRTKWNNNQNREGYLWPDIDNTDLAFEYNKQFIIKPFAELADQQKKASQNLINLTGIDRTADDSSLKDTRWRNRNEAWAKAEAMYEAWQTGLNQPGLRIAIPEVAHSTGFYSIWMAVFATVPEVQNAIRQKFPNTYQQVDEHGRRIIRPGALI